MTNSQHDEERSPILEFLQARYGDSCSTDARLVVWSATSKANSAFPSLEAAARAMGGAMGDVYFAACLMRPPQPGDPLNPKTNKPLERGKGMAVVMPGVWVDVDFTKEGHSYPPDAAAALAAVKRAVNLEPTEVVATGGGVHVWWLFEEPWILDDESRPRAEALARGIQATIRAAFEEQSWELDYTHDLARVLRPVGTANHKRGWEVQLDVEGGPRHTVEAFGEWVTDLPYEDGVSGEAVADLVAGWDVAVRPAELGGEVPPKVALLIDSDARFASTWGGKRRDFNAGGVPDQSRYDLAIASTLAAVGGFSDQEIVDTLALHRGLLKGQGPKRPDYYARTILKARGEARAANEAKAREECLSAALTAASENGALDPSERNTLVAALRDAWGGWSSDTAGVGRVIRFRGAAKGYRVELVGEEDPWVEFDDLASHAACRRALLGVGLVMRASRKAWPRIVDAVVGLSEVVVVEGTSEDTYLLEDILEGYLSSEANVAEEGAWTEQGSMSSFVASDGTLWLSLEGLSRWVRMTRGRDAPSAAALSKMLRAKQLRRERRRTPGSEHPRRFWLVPASHPIRGAKQGDG